MANSYKKLLHQIDTFVFDVDGVLTDGGIHITSEGELTRKMNVKDGFALKAALHAGFKVCVITGGTNVGVQKRLENLGITDIHLGAHNKIEVFDHYVIEHKIDLNRLVYMGDDIPDFPVMLKAGLPCCPQDACPEIKAISKYISHKNGGEGAVRDIIEQVLKVQGKWMTDFEAQNN